MAYVTKPDTGGGEVAKFSKIGDTVEGIYLGGSLDPNGKYGPAMKHMFQTDKGIKVAFSRPNSQLTSLLSGEEGKKVLVTFANQRPSGKGNPTKLYTLGIDPDFNPLTVEEVSNILSESVNDDNGGDTQEDETNAAAQLSAVDRAARTKQLLAKGNKLTKN